MRKLKKVLLAVGLLQMAAVTLCAEVSNFWPFYVSERDSAVGRADYGAWIGPLLAQTDRGGQRIVSLRPLWTRIVDTESGATSSHVLYPLANWYAREGAAHGHVLNLVRYRAIESPRDRAFDLFPFIFYRNQADFDRWSLAVWPVGGRIDNRFWRDQIHFAAWPLFVQTKVGDETRWHLPYPFVRWHSGPRSSGFGLWPLYGQFEREGDYRRAWALWPLYYRYETGLNKDVSNLRTGFWPVYHYERGAGMHSHGWIWPFFGYTREYAPRETYSENRYFYPFWIQGHGENKRVNRWLPFYASESRPGRSHQWYLWPLLKREQWDAGPIERERTTVGWFIYRDEIQRLSETRRARLATLWPLYSFWNDGGEQRQFQLLDPFTMFFPRNQKVKENWSPLFAVYRYDERAGNRRHSVLWDLITYESDDDEGWKLTITPLIKLKGKPQ